MVKKTKKSAIDDHMHARLEAALAVNKKARTVEAKPLRRRLDEIAFYPAHDKRAESAGYKAAHHRLVVELDTPCRVCGVRNSTLKVARENPFGARAIETHHCVIEWALANAIDPGKFNRALLPQLRAEHPGNALYRKKALSRRKIAAWVDHSEDNLLVLCDVHHQAQYFGIHSISYPVWEAQGLLRRDFEAFVRERLPGSGREVH